MASSILGAFEGVKTKKKNKDDIQYIYYKDIRSAPKNRDTGDIEELAEDIAEDGLDHNLVLRKIDDEDHKYEIVAGHRRYLAICHNINKGDSTYEYIPAKVKSYDDVDAVRRLHLNNINGKPYTPGEMLTAIEDLKEVYRIKKERGEKMPGRVQELIARDTGLGKTQVGNYEKIINNAVEPVKELVKNDEITLNEALEISEMDDENQMKFVEDNAGDISLTTIKDYKETLSLEEDISDEGENEDYEEYGEDDINCDDFDDTDDDDDDIDEPYSKPEKTDKSVTHYSVSELVIEIQTNLYLLKNKINGVEWKKEQIMLEEMIKLMTELKESAGV